MSALATRFLDAQLAGDRREALRLALEEGLARGAKPEDIHMFVVGASQREIGRLWQENRITVAEEHQATAISQVVLAHVFPHFARSPRLGRSVLVACVEGELHDMAARIASDILDAAGFDVRFLGASVPTDELLKMLRAKPVDALALSVTMTFHLSMVRQAVAAVRAACGPGLPILVGGEAVVATPPLSPDDRVFISRGSARDLVRTLRFAVGLSEVSGEEEVMT